MKTFSEEVREARLESCGYRCETWDCFNMAEEAHHIVPNTKVNQKLYPNYLHSPFNLMFLCYGCHHQRALPKKPTEMKLREFEKYLTKLKMGE